MKQPIKIQQLLADLADIREARTKLAEIRALDDDGTRASIGFFGSFNGGILRHAAKNDQTKVGRIYRAAINWTIADIDKEINRISKLLAKAEKAIGGQS